MGKCVKQKDWGGKQEVDPKLQTLYNTWKATGCPNLPESMWGGWAWYLKQRKGTVLHDMYLWCTYKSKNHRRQCCQGKACTPKCVKQKDLVSSDGEGEEEGPKPQLRPAPSVAVKKEEEKTIKVGGKGKMI